MMKPSPQKRIKIPIRFLVWLISAALVVLIALATYPKVEYIAFDKPIEFANKTFYVYKYVTETPLGIKYITTKYVCPMKLENTTCIVSDRALICEGFSCLVYKGMIKG